MIESLTVKSRATEEFIDITAQVQDIVSRSRTGEGICVIYTPHTTAAITINENADPAVQKDILNGLRHLKFDQVDFSHAEGNSHAHIKSSLIGCSETVILDNGRLNLGTWQGIYFCEFDGPRTRTVLVTILSQT
ncbi:MAG TPA: secondary thiamine-phosphate synthase enzyme YjbQ [Spirochaetota bacterium]|nr:secondary thiamine-phosphate synthase enzyme YjbQ [Spirochaetota bacterium]HPL17553.1 secondary thiamine-phosphate synthase enzyme YjbQ [Spirochaetota bacterium]HRS75924.1 secondary thiamine-phosphate synthase enzyme YjbQ [Spirochaetota bacterium]HRT75053.1 secondary thiamine-phosphate synthase enzyme YjbQ [Spirochaetota bacterium]